MYFINVGYIKYNYLDYKSNAQIYNYYYTKLPIKNYNITNTCEM